MKKPGSIQRFLIVLLLATGSLYQMPSQVRAEEPSLAEANQIFDYAEDTFPDLFPPPATSSGEAVELGFRFYYRYYQSTDTFAAVNRDDGFVWALGPYFGPQAVQVMSVEAALALIPSFPPLTPGQGAMTNPGTGNCFAFGTPQAGTLTVERQLSFGTSDDAEVRTETTVLVSTPTVVTTDIDYYRDGQLIMRTLSTHYYERNNGLLYISESDDEGELFGVVSGSYSSQAAYEPDRLQGPADGFCEGQEWYTPAGAVTTAMQSTLVGNTTTTSPLSAKSSRVETIESEVVSVPAGSFDTVKVTISEKPEDGTEVRSEIWVDVSTGTGVQSRYYHDGELVHGTELLEVSY